VLLHQRAPEEHRGVGERCIHETLHVVLLWAEQRVLPLHEGLHASALLHATGEGGTRAHHTDIGMGIQVVHLLRQAFRMAHIIGIHASDGGATGMGLTGVQRVGDADARFV
jgi:hypothetical protein